MKSFDIFDTSVGRWYYYDTYYPRDHDFDTELAHVFPIIENRNQIDKDTLLITDTYFTREQIEQILQKCGITEYKDILCSYDGKSSGRVWQSVETTLHTGDNYHSDVVMPTKYGKQAVHYTNNKLSINEYWLESHGYDNLAYFCRMLRLLNPHVKDSPEYLIWNDQTQGNLPLLILLSNYIQSLTFKYNLILLTLRDCELLYRIFNSRFPKSNVERFYTNRQMYTYHDKVFVDYVNQTVKNNTLVFDLQATGKSFYEFFSRQDYTPDFMTVVLSNIHPHDSRVQYLFKTEEGYSDNIERLNDVNSIKYPWGNEPVELNNPYIKVQNDCIDLAVDYILQGYILPVHYDFTMIRDFMNYIEGHCTIRKYEGL